jgi:hypothetical protein
MGAPRYANAGIVKRAAWGTSVSACGQPQETEEVHRLAAVPVRRVAGGRMAAASPHMGRDETRKRQGWSGGRPAPDAGHRLAPRPRVGIVKRAAWGTSGIGPPVASGDRRVGQ